ncbi:hypothetical protein KEJ36_03845, partial [Candidatus Bathyarchaeota archaeon]|nr:hypothetical protein [Candidatus Bathyarchaeota archaeon]
EAEFNSYLSFDGSLATLSAYEAALKLAYDTTFDPSGRGLTCVWMDRNYNWRNQTFRNRVGESLNLAVNYLADVLYTLYMEFQSKKQTAFDFIISVYPGNGTVRRGLSIGTQIRIEVILLKGTSQLVNITVSGLPPGTSYVLNLSSGTPPFTSTLNITPGPSTPGGTYHIAVRGVGGGLNKTATYVLTILEPEGILPDKPWMSMAFVLFVVFAFGVVAIALIIVLIKHK